MATIKAVLLKPLDGDAEGTVREFDKPDFERLKGMDAVREAGAGNGELVKQAAAPENKMDMTHANKSAGRGK